MDELRAIARRAMEEAKRDREQRQRTLRKRRLNNGDSQHDSSPKFQQAESRGPFAKYGFYEGRSRLPDMTQPVVKPRTRSLSPATQRSRSLRHFHQKQVLGERGLRLSSERHEAQYPPQEEEATSVHLVRLSERSAAITFATSRHLIAHAQGQPLEKAPIPCQMRTVATASTIQGVSTAPSHEKEQECVTAPQLQRLNGRSSAMTFATSRHLMAHLSGRTLNELHGTRDTRKKPAWDFSESDENTDCDEPKEEPSTPLRCMTARRIAKSDEAAGTQKDPTALPDAVLRELLIRLRMDDLNAMIAAFPTLQRFMDAVGFRIARCRAGHFGAHGPFRNDHTGPCPHCGTDIA